VLGRAANQGKNEVRDKFLLRDNTYRSAGGRINHHQGICLEALENRERILGRGIDSQRLAHKTKVQQDASYHPSSQSICRSWPQIFPRRVLGIERTPEAACIHRAHERPRLVDERNKA
jgi:hypothetical protein